MHTAMRHAVAARREVGGRTVFNLLGPLTNPAGARAQVIGVPSLALVDKLGHALAELEVLRAFVVHGVDGIDEISLSDETEVADVRPHSVQRYRIAPEDFGVARRRARAWPAAMRPRMRRSSARVLEGERGPEARFCVHQCGGGAGGRGARRGFSRRRATARRKRLIPGGAGEARGAHRIFASWFRHSSD